MMKGTGVYMDSSIVSKIDKSRTYAKEKERVNITSLYKPALMGTTTPIRSHSEKPDGIVSATISTPGAYAATPWPWSESLKVCWLSKRGLPQQSNPKPLPGQRGKARIYLFTALTLIRIDKPI